MSKKGLAGKILRPDGTDVSDRDRSKDGTIIVRKPKHPDHRNFFGQIPEMPWNKKKKRRFAPLIRAYIIAISLIAVSLLVAIIWWD